MEKVHEGLELKYWMRSTGINQGEYAKMLSMSRQTLNYHLRMPVLLESFKLKLSSLPGYKKSTNSPAAPYNITRRDYFAAMIAQGMAKTADLDRDHAEEITHDIVAITDALIKRLDKV